MDIEKLIERLRENTECWTDKVHGYADLRLEAATALSALQAENERLRKELEYEREHANAYHEECGQWEAENEKLRAESIMHHNAADNYWHELNEYRQERNEALAELEQVKNALAMMWFAYVNSDKETPNSYETEALEEAERLLGPWAECMPKYLRCGQRED